MIIYRELSSLEKDLGVSSKMLYTLSNQRHRHYRNVKISKGNGEFRQLCVPDDFLKAVQTKIALNLLGCRALSVRGDVRPCCGLLGAGEGHRCR